MKRSRVGNVYGANEIQGFVRRGIWNAPDKQRSLLGRNENNCLGLEHLRRVFDLRRRHIPERVDLTRQARVEEVIARRIRLIKPTIAGTSGDSTSGEKEGHETEEICLPHGCSAKTG